MKRAANGAVNLASTNAGGVDMNQTTDVSKLAKQVAAEWRDGSTPATSNEAPISDTVPFFNGAPGTAGRPQPSDSGPMDGRSRGVGAMRSPANGRELPQENVYRPPPGFGQSGAPLQRNAERHVQSGGHSLAAEGRAAPDPGVSSGVPSGPLQGLKNLLIGSRGSTREPASPAQPRGYIQLADVVNNLSGMQTVGQLPHSPVAGARLSAITPPDVVSTTNGDGHSENGMLAAFTILGDCFQMIEVRYM